MGQTFSHLFSTTEYKQPLLANDDDATATATATATADATADAFFVNELDPRSPTTAFARTPLGSRARQLAANAIRTFDPRSPTCAFKRTPLRWAAAGGCDPRSPMAGRTPVHANADPREPAAGRTPLPSSQLTPAPAKRATARRLLADMCDAADDSDDSMLSVESDAEATTLPQCGSCFGDANDSFVDVELDESSRVDDDDCDNDNDDDDDDEPMFRAVDLSNWSPMPLKQTKRYLLLSPKAKKYGSPRLSLCAVKAAVAAAVRNWSSDDKADDDDAASSLASELALQPQLSPFKTAGVAYRPRVVCDERASLSCPSSPAA